MQRDTFRLRGDSPGTARSLRLYRYGTPGQGPKIYLQAGLHADEMPGVLVLHHLMTLLDNAEPQVTGEVLVVPAANPVGLGLWGYQRPLGRQEAGTLNNFNRGFADLAALTGDGLEHRLTGDCATNRDLIRAAFRAASARLCREARTDMGQLQALLLHHSCDADYVLDLHCDHRAVLHLYTSPARPADTDLLCRATGAQLALIQDISGGHAFDEAHTAPWLLLQRRFAGRYPIPDACFATTLEYRGQFDVADATALQDAQNLMTFLAAIGALQGWDEAPRHPAAPCYPLGGAAEVFAPHAGVVTWQAAPGDRVQAGETLGHVTDAASRRRSPLPAPCDGMMFRAELWPSCLRGASLAHVAGENVLRDGDLLSD